MNNKPSGITLLDSNEFNCLDESSLDKRHTLNNKQYIFKLVEELLNQFEKYPFLIGMIREVEKQHYYAAEHQIRDSIILLFDWHNQNNFCRGRVFPPSQYLTPLKMAVCDEVNIDGVREKYDESVCTGSLENLVL